MRAGVRTLSTSQGTCDSRGNSVHSDVGTQPTSHGSECAGGGSVSKCRCQKTVLRVFKRNPACQSLRENKSAPSMREPEDSRAPCGHTMVK